MTDRPTARSNVSASWKIAQYSRDESRTPTAWEINLHGVANVRLVVHQLIGVPEAKVEALEYAREWAERLARALKDGDDS